MHCRYCMQDENTLENILLWVREKPVPGSLAFVVGIPSHLPFITLALPVPSH